MSKETKLEQTKVKIGCYNELVRVNKETINSSRYTYDYTKRKLIKKNKRVRLTICKLEEKCDKIRNSIDSKSAKPNNGGSNYER